jgi:hypothetical protein
MFRGLLMLAPALAPVLAAGCATSKPPLVDFSPAPRDYRSADYEKIYDRWTRHGKVIHEVEPALEVWATYKSWDFREAYVAHYAERYKLDDEARERLRTTQREAAAEAYEFLVTAQSANYKWNDLEKKKSPWRVTLVDGLGKEQPPETLKVEKLPDIFEREFFPAKTPFSRTYSIRFTRAAAGDGDASGGFVGERSGSIALRLAGPMGTTDLVWLSK